MTVRTLPDLVFHVAARSAGRADLLAIRRQGQTQTWSTQRFVRAIHALALALEARGFANGTTGEPKGVMLTKKNLVSNMLAAGEVFAMGPEDLALSFLPLSHVFERTCDHLFFYRGVAVHYVPAIERVPPSLPEVKPTVLPSLPRLYERAYLKGLATQQKESPLRRRVFSWALGVGKRATELSESGRRRGPWLMAQQSLAQRLVYGKLQERFGGRLRLP